MKGEVRIRMEKDKDLTPRQSGTRVHLIPPSLLGGRSDHISVPNHGDRFSCRLSIHNNDFGSSGLPEAPDMLKRVVDSGFFIKDRNDDRKSGNHHELSVKPNSFK
jgi:hypothetical protein